MSRYHELAELAPRDVVARSILSEMLSEETDCEYLDLRHLSAARMHERFPTISAICRSYGLDLAKDLLPVAPAAHYCMGGVMTDTYGRTTLAGLYAVGEVACTGVHGGNRLASNSLLEGLVFGLRLAAGLAGINDEQADAFSRQALTVPVYDDLSREEALLSVWPDRESILQMRREIRQVMWKYVSLQRNRQGLLESTKQLHNLHTTMLTNGSTSQNNVVEWLETVNMLKVAELVIAAAFQRRESRGSHWRLDYPAPNEMLTGRHYAFQPVLAGFSQEGVMAQEDLLEGGRKGTPLLYNDEYGDHDSYMVGACPCGRPRGGEEIIFNV